jgi:hypothetical protein
MRALLQAQGALRQKQALADVRALAWAMESTIENAIMYRIMPRVTPKTVSKPNAMDAWPLAQQADAIHSAK